MKKVMGILGGITVALVALVAMAAEKSAGRTALDLRASHEKEQEHEMVKSLMRANQRLPMMLNEQTRIDRMTAEAGRVIVYHYTKVTYTLPEEGSSALHDAYKLDRPEMIKGLCSDVKVRKILNDNYTIDYRYYDRKGQKLFDILFKRADCDA